MVERCGLTESTLQSPPYTKFKGDDVVCVVQIENQTSGVHKHQECSGQLHVCDISTVKWGGGGGGGMGEKGDGGQEIRDWGTRASGQGTGDGGQEFRDWGTRASGQGTGDGGQEFRDWGTRASGLGTGDGGQEFGDWGTRASGQGTGDGGQEFRDWGTRASGQGTGDGGWRITCAWRVGGHTTFIYRSCTQSIYVVDLICSS